MVVDESWILEAQVRFLPPRPNKENIMAIFVVLVIMFVLYQVLKKY